MFKNIRMPLGVILAAFVAFSGADVGAQTVRVVEGATQAPLNVPLNSAAVVESDVVFAEINIANPEIADISTLSDRTFYVLGNAAGRTTVTLIGPDGRLISNIDVIVQANITEVKERLAQLLPGEKIEVRSANTGLILSGTVSSGQKLTRALQIAGQYSESVVNLMDVGGTQQVSLKVRFAEMTRSASKQLSSVLNVVDAFGSGGSGAFAGSGSVSGNPAGQLVLGLVSGSLSADLTIQALENKGVIRTLAEPNLTALSGKTATFLAGGEYPFPTLGENNQVGVQYRNFGVNLTFTPTVVDDDIINLALETSVSSIDTGSVVTIGSGTSTVDVNGFTQRSTSTTVEMRDGQSFAISGILQDDFNDTVTQIPFLGDIPILGALFRSAGYNRNQTELVIIITAHLVSPTSGEALALPTDRIRPPTEGELFGFGRVAVGTSQGTSSSRGTATPGLDELSVPHGYVID